MGMIRAGDSKIKLRLGDKKIKRAYKGDEKIYSAGNIVTYHLDSGATYQEEIDEGESCLSPKTFIPAKSGWEFVGWRADAIANSNVYTSYVMQDNPVTLYAVFRAAVTVTYYDGSRTPKTSVGYKYYNNGAVQDASFALSQTSISGWTARGWSTGAAANSGITYGNGTAFTRASNITLYGMYQQTITLTIYNGSATAASQSGTRYYCPGSGSVANPAFTVTPASLSGWSFNGWCTSSGATAGIAYSSISGMEFSASTTVYARYSKTVTLSYNANGGTGGNVAAQSGTCYYNSSGALAGATFTVAANGFSRTSAIFKAWALNSANGTQYAVGTSITLSESAVMYAVWTGANMSILSHVAEKYVSNGTSVTGYGTNLSLPCYMYQLICDYEIDCSLYGSVQIGIVSASTSENYGGGAIFGIYESGGGFLPLCWAVSDASGSGQGKYVQNGGVATLNLQKMSGKSKLYFGFECYGNTKIHNSTSSIQFKDIVLIGR